MKFFYKVKQDLSETHNLFNKTTYLKKIQYIIIFSVFSFPV